MPARCAASSARPPRPSFSIPATSMTAPSRPRPVSRATRKASSIAATPTPQSRCSRRACARWKGAEAARGTASGMAAVAASLLCHLKSGDHVVSARALFGSCRYIVEDLLPRFGIATTLIDGRDLSAWEAAVRPNTRAFFFETPTNPVLELVDIEAVSEIAQEGRRAGGGRQRVRHAAAPAADEARRRHRGLFGDQAYRRPGALPRRRRARAARSSSRRSCTIT